MNFLLKIVEGPNKGAEIALVEGVAVTIGKSDTCDIVLADATLPDESVSMEATADGVIVGGEALAPFHVKTMGSTSLAVGPADAAWGELVWPKNEPEETASEPEAEEHEEAEPKADAAPQQQPAPEEKAAAEKRRRGGVVGCLISLIGLLLVLVGLAWFFRDTVRPYAGKAWRYTVAKVTFKGEEQPAEPAPTLESLAEKYGLSIEETEDCVKMSGNLKTRRERLAATAEAYAIRPGVELDFSDDESLRTAAEDSLFTMTEGALKVVVATNRLVEIAGVSPSPASLKAVLRALAADLPKMRHFDVSGVVVANTGVVDDESDSGNVDAPSEIKEAVRSPRHRRKVAAASSALDLPVCGILTVPYPCLVMKNGTRLLEGAAINDSIIMKIEADSVTLTNSTGKITWKP